MSVSRKHTNSLLNLRLLNWPPFIPARRLGYESPPWRVLFFVSLVIASSWKRVYTCYLGNDAFSAIYCNVSIFVAAETWSPSRCLAVETWLRLHYYTFQVSCHSMLIPSEPQNTSAFDESNTSVKKSYKREIKSFDTEFYYQYIIKTN
jgi:hypothetical protein